mmetsp:Transcript_32262/g.47035  ORF Transcript_32262/g.47035 Transcript_32262/m.47035 type:complete len:89 (+) Transcript_32262:1396-1662(+)
MMSLMIRLFMLLVLLIRIIVSMMYFWGTLNFDLFFLRECFTLFVFFIKHFVLLFHLSSLLQTVEFVLDSTRTIIMTENLKASGFLGSD